MAQIILGLATPHAPQLRLPFEAWAALREKDETDRRIDYAGMLRRARPGLEDEVVEGTMRARYDSIQAQLKALGEVLAKAAPDVIVVVGDDQQEQFKDENMPMFSVFWGDAVQLPKPGQGHGGSGLWNAPHLDAIQHAVHASEAAAPEQPANPGLALHLIDSLRRANFDVAASNRLKPDVGLGHAFAFVYNYLPASRGVPMVPVMVNTFFPPNQPTPRRCYALGQALRRAIEGWDSDSRVAVIASGGLSHTILDEEIDRATVDAVMERDADALRSLPTDRLNLGTSEIRNWVAVAAAMEPLTPRLLGDYVPAYRSPAGTGCGFAFACWE